MKKYIIILMVIVIPIILTYFFFNLLDAEPPKPTIIVEGSRLEVAQGSYCWNSGSRGKCVDMISPPEIIKHHNIQPLVVSPGAEVKIKFKKEPNSNSLGVSLWTENLNVESISLRENIFLAPKEKGVYIFDVHANWEQGSSAFVFILEVK